MLAFQNNLKWVTRVCFWGWVTTCFLLLRLPPPEDLVKEVFDAPIQQDIPPEQSDFIYKNQKITVISKAEYTITGVIVSHNDPQDWYTFDLSHDKQSPDTRDICIIWGDNLRKDDYRKASYYNTDKTCEWKYGKDLTYFSDEEIANNHLITDDADLRKRIGALHIGDEVRITGKLADYSEERWPGLIHRTSLTRAGKKDGDSEIIFVKGLEVIKSYNGWAAIMQILFFWGVFVSVAIRAYLFMSIKEL